MKPVLIVDDSPSDLEAAACMLQRCRVLNPLVLLPNGESAINYLAGKGQYSDREASPYPVLMLLDLKMRGVSGEDVLRWVKETQQPISVVVFTGLEIQHVKDCYALGAQSFLTKPIDEADFANLLNRLPGVIVRLGNHGVYFERPS